MPRERIALSADVSEAYGTMSFEFATEPKRGPFPSVLDIVVEYRLQ